MRTSNSVRVHFSTTNLNVGPAACGRNRDSRRRLTLDVDAVTCRKCIMTVAFIEAAEAVEVMRTEQDRSGQTEGGRAP